MNLIGGNLALKLNLLTLNINNVATCGNKNSIQHESNTSFSSSESNIKAADLQQVILKYSNVFTGVGKFNGSKIKLHINKNVTPVAQKARRIPFNLRQKVEAELEHLRKHDIIEDVLGEPTPWVSPIVVVRKNNNEDQVRLCIDMRQPNKAIEWTRHPLPCLDDLMHDLQGSKLFCKLDMNKAFLQFVLEEESRSITTFATHKVVHRFKRLNFGMTSASEELQQKLEYVLQGIENCKNIADDIILYAENKTKLHEVLLQVLDRFSEYNLTLNLQKCEFYVPSVEFFGFIFSNQGISPSPSKIESIKLYHRM